MTMTILGIGTAAPPALRQADAAALAQQRCCASPQQARLLQSVYRQSTVDARGSVLLGAKGNGRDTGDAAHNRAAIERFYQPPRDAMPLGPTLADRMTHYADRAPPLAERAARSALDRAAVAPAGVAQLIVVSCTGFFAPGVEFHLIESLGLPPTAGRTMIGFMGCHGAINGLRVADALASSRPGEPVLMCAVELCSLHFQYGWDPQRVVANALFADGAAAMVGVAGEQSPGSPRVLATGSCVIPDSRDDMTWTLGDHGFAMTLSPRVPSLIERHLRPWLTRWLTTQNLTLDDIGSWAVHPGGPRIVDAVENALGLPPDATAASRGVLTDHGNMSSPTVLFILERLRHQRASMPCIALAFGPGLVAEAALIG